MNTLIELLQRLLTESDHDSGVAGVRHEEGDFGLDVAMTDGTEYHIEVSEQ